jgi:hypothetical protein
VCLIVPIVPPSRAGGGLEREQQKTAIHLMQHDEAQASSPELGP